MPPTQQPNSVIGQESEIDSEEEHVLRVAGRPAVGIARLEESTGLGTSLLDKGLDEFVDELGDDEAKSEEHGLELSAEDEVGDETTEADEDRDERDPCQAMP